MNLNEKLAKTITVIAQWKANCASGVTCVDVDLAVNETKDFSYTGTVQGATLTKAGYYKLEVWGAQGGAVNTNGVIETGPGYSGTGGYSVGVYQATTGQVLYIYVIIALSHHNPRYWKRRRHEQGEGKAAWARSGD